VKPSSTEIQYRALAVQEATPAGLVVILYDILVGDLRRAMAAMQANHVEERTTRLKHGLSALQVLEGSLDLAKGGDAERSLSYFYSHIRSQILCAQFQNDPAILERQIDLILSVREAWQEVSMELPRQSGDHQASQAGVESMNVAMNHAVGSNWSA
jgi:flagellar secretion chaperone FliS